MNFYDILENVEFNVEKISKRWVGKVYWGWILGVIECYGREFGFYVLVIWIFEIWWKDIERFFKYFCLVAVWKIS